MTQEELQRLFTYNNGELYWRVAPSKKVRVGDIVGSCIKSGYKQTSVNKRRWYVHRLIFLLHHGYLPEEVDHIDGDKRNNRVENLRAATRSQNQYNIQVGRKNTSGIKGVYWHKQRQKWHARVKFRGKPVSAGLFADKQSAKAAVEQLREQLHKEFKNHG